MDGEGGAHLLDEAGDAQVLDDHGIDAGTGDGFEIIGGGKEFIGEDQSVEGDEAFDIVGMEVLHDAGKFRDGEIGGAVAGVEIAEAEVDGVSAVGDGGAHGFPVAGGCKEFGFGLHTILVQSPLLYHTGPMGLTTTVESESAKWGERLAIFP